MPDSRKARLLTHQARGAAAAIVLVHGFGGDAAETWGAFPRLLMEEPRLAGWDLYSIGYSTSLAFDIAGVWTADPEMTTLGSLVQTLAAVEPLDRYRSIAFMAHSMGGLLLQQALLSDSALCRRVSHLLLFGTPSAGLEKASPFQFWKRQVRDMALDSPFITTLRADWSAQFAEGLPFTFLTVAGERDEFVPSTSSLAPFPAACQRVVYGNHLDIVKPTDTEHVGYKVALKALTREGETDVAVDSARLAVESREFQQAINTLWPNRQELDDKALVILALALDSVGRRQDAIAALTGATPRGTDPVGVLAGRLKRRWLAERRRADAEQALALYGQAFARSDSIGNAEQAYYHAINCAFMELAYGGDISACRHWAEQAQRHCLNARDDVWRRATQGEAHLYLGNGGLAADAYRQALALDPAPWQASSIYQQAYRAADLMGEDVLAAALRQMFGGQAAVRV